MFVLRFVTAVQYPFLLSTELMRDPRTASMAVWSMRLVFSGS